MPRVTRYTTVDLPTIERRCQSVANRLAATELDDMSLLRLARTLKGINRDLRVVVGRQQCDGQLHTAQRAISALSMMECHLRAVLLDDGTLRKHEMRRHVTGAASQAADALEILSLQCA